MTASVLVAVTDRRHEVEVLVALEASAPVYDRCHPLDHMILATRAVQSGFYHGSSSRGAGGNPRRRDGNPQQRQVIWQPKRSVPAAKVGTEQASDGAKSKTTEEALFVGSNSNGSTKRTAVDSFHFGETVLQLQRDQDPMMEEALIQTANRCSLPNVSQCSVEPTVAKGAEVVPGQPARSAAALREQGQPKPVQVQKGDSVDPVPVSQEVEPSAGIQIQMKEVEGTLGQSSLMPLRATELGPPLPISGLEIDGLPFDLNQEAHVVPQCFSAPSGVDQGRQTAPKGRTILGSADGRINKHTKDAAIGKAAPKSVARFAVPLKKALLCNPAARAKVPHTKKMAQTNAVREKNSGSKEGTKKPAMTIEDQASLLLMKATGVVEEGGSITEEAEQAFGEQFIDPLIEEPVTDIRIALGLPGMGRADVLGALVTEADGADD
ncbi:unnamed protein product [Urochloa humidicola]